MRIRSIKPDFWSSDDIADLHWYDRLLFIGLWSYVDDNGAGTDRIASIVGDLFSGDLETDPGLIFERVKNGLDTLEEKGLIERYECCGKRWLHITSWQRHQKINNPSKFFKSHLPPRLANPDDHTRASKSVRTTEPLRSPSGAAPESLHTREGSDDPETERSDLDVKSGAREVEVVSESIPGAAAGKPPLTGHSPPTQEEVRSDSVRATEGVHTGDEETRRRGDEELSSSDAADAASDDDSPIEVSTEARLLCDLLLSLMAQNGDAPRPTHASKAWLRSADLLIRRDKRDPATAMGMLRWAKQDDFWAPNVKSMPTFREKYDQIAAQAKRGVKAQRRSVAEQLRARQSGGEQ